MFDYYTRTGRDRSYTIGQFPDWTAAAARAKARELRRLVDDGGDPLAELEAERAAPTVAELIDRFEQEHLPRKRPATARDYRARSRCTSDRTSGRMPRSRTSPSPTSTRSTARSPRAAPATQRTGPSRLMSKMFYLAIRWGMRETNPAKGLERNIEHHRRRYLSGEELGRLVKALAEYPDRQAADIVRLLLLTGARRGEVLSARWADLDLGKGVWSKPPSSTKQKDHHEAQLSAPTRALLDRIRDEQAGKPRHALPTFVFPGTGTNGHMVEIKKAWQAIIKAAGITGLRIHDLRHSFASAAISGGASLPLVGSLLGHASPATTNRYAHMFNDPQRAVVERIGKLVEDAGKASPENVMPLLMKGGGAS